MLKYARVVELVTTLETAAKNVKELTIATRQDMEVSKLYDFLKIGRKERRETPCATDVEILITL